MLHLFEELDLLRGTVDSQQGTGMSHLYLVVLQRHLHLSRQFQQTHVVGDGSTALADTLTDLGLRHTRRLCQMLVGQSNLDGVQVLALYVLHQCHLHHSLIFHGDDVGRYLRQASQLRGTPTALTGNDLVSAVLHLSYRDGLDDAQLTDAVGQFLQGILVKFAARLVGVRLYECYLHLVQVR